MGVQLDKVTNLSSTYGAAWGTFVPAVTNGLEVFSLFGNTLPTSLLNQGSAGVSTVVGLPTVLSPSGLTMNGGAASAVKTAYTDIGGSMTVMVVAQVPLIGSASSVLGSFASSESTNINSVFSLRWSAASFIGCTLVLGYTTSAGAGTSTVVQGAASNTSAVMAQMALPNFFIGKVDMATLKASISCSTAPTILTGGTATLPAGATRPSTGNPIQCPSASGVEASPTNSQQTIHSLIVFNRATSPAEDAQIYAQMKGIMATRGITI